MKLVKESLNEIVHFERSNDPLVTLQVGKRAQIIKWLNTYDIKNYVINDDWTIDVKNNVYLTNKQLTFFPDYIKFNHVEGHFYFRNNKLSSLIGCPIIVDGDFAISSNQLISLEGCPKYVYGDFSCYYNNVKFTQDDVRNYC